MDTIENLELFAYVFFGILAALNASYVFIKLPYRYSPGHGGAFVPVGTLSQNDLGRLVVYEFLAFSIGFILYCIAVL